MNNIDWSKLPQDGKLAGKIVEGHVVSEQEKAARGALGGMFGSKANVPANVAALIAVVGAACLFVGVFSWAGQESFTHKDAVATVSSLVTLTVGFLFGRAIKD